MRYTVFCNAGKWYVRDNERIGNRIYSHPWLCGEDDKLLAFSTRLEAEQLVQRAEREGTMSEFMERDKIGKQLQALEYELSNCQKYWVDVGHFQDGLAWFQKMEMSMAKIKKVITQKLESND